MGVFWRSYAEVISTEPKVIKQLIEKIEEDGEETAPVYDLKIEGNSVLFNSGGYGCYGSDPEYRLIHCDRVMLFKRLFENYDKALVCFEVVEPCQGQGYYFSITWAKPDGKIDWISQEDWDDEEYEDDYGSWGDYGIENHGKTFSIVCNIEALQEGRQCPDFFDNPDDLELLEDQFYTEFYTKFTFRIWFLSFETLDTLKLPSIKKLINLAQEEGFTDWAINPNSFPNSLFPGDKEYGITMKTLQDIDNYLYLSDKYDQDLVDNAVCHEAVDNCFYHFSYNDLDLYDAEFELPTDFPELKSAFKKAYGKEQAEIKTETDNEVKLNLKNVLILRLRTQDSLIELLQAGKSGAWKIEKKKEKQISKIQIFNWDGSLMLEASYDNSSNERQEDNLLIIGLSSEDAKIVKCNPPVQWVGENSIEYFYEVVKKTRNELNEPKIETINEPPPHAPEGCEAISQMIAELCESTYGEPIRLIDWQNKDDNKQYNTLFRERRRGWYIQMLLTENDGQWSSEHRVLPSFLNLLEPDETTWAKLTKKATPEDWCALDEIFFNTLTFPDSTVILAGSDLIGKEVAEEAMEKFGFYIPHEDVLPVLLFENSHLKVKLVSYFKHPNGFAKENMLSDDNTDQCEVLESLTEAEQRLNQKLSYYTKITMTQEKTYLELSEDNGVSHKFYEVTVKVSEVIVRYGRIGTTGNTQSKTYPTPEKAKAEATKKINQKLKKGYEHSVMGLRKKRPITRRQVTSTRSQAKQAPILWKFASGSSAFGIFIDAERCWLGNQAGKVFALDHQGQVLNQFQLPNGVKCLVADEDWIYGGCDDGKVYDLTGKIPRVAYEIDENVDIYWLDIYDGLLGVSDANGGVTTIDHEEKSQWTRLSQGDSGWMVRCDQRGIYHGHSAGVTMYDAAEGRMLWHQPTRGNVLFGWQETKTVYAGTSDRKVYCFTKDGKAGTVYQCDASVYSCATACQGKYVFAGDSSSSIYCFKQTGERLWKLGTRCGSALSMQYLDERVYIVTTDGYLACIDASSAAIAAAQAGNIPEAVTLKAPKTQGTAPSNTLETTSDTSQGVIVQCVREGERLRIRVVSPGYNSDWNVQFPRDIREEGARYIVEEIKESARGGFYRAFGDIKKLV